jgi:hypothetical protein
MCCCLAYVLFLFVLPETSPLHLYIPFVCCCYKLCSWRWLAEGVLRWPFKFEA